MAYGLEDFLKELQEYRRESIFNPWGQSDTLHDIGEQAPDIRLDHLRRYLEERRDAKYLLIAEALGYQGGHFSGIAMTSERQMIYDNSMMPEIIHGDKCRTSDPDKLDKPTLIAEGFTEPTGTIVWKTLRELLDTRDWINWNSYPFHPYVKDGGLLTNRTPTEDEKKAGVEFTRKFLSLFPDRKIISIGRISEEILTTLDIPHTHVRHPANGGATKFKYQVTAFIKD